MAGDKTTRQSSLTREMVRNGTAGLQGIIADEKDSSFAHYLAAAARRGFE